MALKLGNPDSRIIDIEAIEPLNGNKTARHTFQVEFAILPNQQWRDTLADAETPLIEVIGGNIRNMTGIVDDDGAPVSYCDEVKQAVLEARWLHGPLIDGFMAVQGGMTTEAYKKAKLKN